MANNIKFLTGSISKLQEKKTDGTLSVPIVPGQVYFALSSDNSYGYIVYDASDTERVVMSSKAASASQDDNGNTISSTYLPLAGGTMTGALNLWGNQYSGTSAYALNCNNSDIVGVNGIFTQDTADNFAEGINFYRTSTTWDSLSAKEGKFYFGSNKAFGAAFTGDADVYAGTFYGTLSGNASSATKLATARTINGTSFDGSANITTAKWGTSRTLSISSAAGTTGTNVDGSANASLVIPSTMTGFTSITSTNFVGNASSATKATQDGNGNTITSTYLPLAGGTMAGTAFISWPDTGNWGNGNSGVTFPVTRGGLTWNGQSDGISLYAVETTNDNLELYLKFTDDNSNGLSIRNNSGTQTARISANGNIIATGATMSGHIYLNGCTTDLATCTTKIIFGNSTTNYANITGTTNNTIAFENSSNLNRVVYDGGNNNFRPASNNTTSALGSSDCMWPNIYGVNYRINNKAIMRYNTTLDCVEFAFI